MFDERPETFPDADLYWADFHKHLTGPDIDHEQLDTVMRYARQHLDASTVLCYPFKWFRHGHDPGIRVESVGNRPEFAAWWEAVQRVSAAHNEPGEFVTFPAYEWHGDRKRWGDHNIIYPTEGEPLDDTAAFPELCKRLRERDAIAIPHHTGYATGSRGKDWDAFDPSISPVMEIYSSHGSSEGVGTPVPMQGNDSMGPRTSGGTFVDALERGHRVGVIASNDGPGLPGTWGRGLAGLWARDLSRAGLREALEKRRTYGITGDRIRLWWEVDDCPMGGLLEHSSGIGRAFVDCPRALDRIDLLSNGSLIDRYTHDRSRRSDPDGLYRVLVELGWGPSDRYGPFDPLECVWDGAVRVSDGTLSDVMPRFRGFGQEYEHVDDHSCAFTLTTTRGDRDVTLPEGDVDMTTQGFVFTVQGSRNSVITIELSTGESFEVTLGASGEETHLFALVDESIERIEETFDLDASSIENHDVFYHNARKVKVHRADPRVHCRATADFAIEDGVAGDAYYVRATQVDGQVAWSSPIWLT